MLKVGDKVPDFTLPVATPDGRAEFQLSKALGRGDLLLAFYPIAFTSTCTEELCDARDNIGFFQHVGADVYGFSTDTPQANAAYAREQELNFPLLSDPNRDVVDRIWETQRVSGVDRVAKRGLMVIDARGVVKWLWKTDDPDEWPGFQDVADVLHSHHHH